MFAYCLNNPISYRDSEGDSASIARPAYKAFDDIYTGVGAGSGTGGAGIIIGVYIAEKIDNAAEKVQEWIEASKNVVERRNHHVYVLRDPNDSNIVKYVGRTTDPARRAYQHKHDVRHPERKNYSMQVLAFGLTRREAMLLEQVVISAYTLDHLDNARREIAVGNIGKYTSYMSAVSELITGATECDLMDLIGG